MTSDHAVELTADDVRRFAAANRFDLSTERAAALTDALAALLRADAELERIDLSASAPVGPLWPQESAYAGS